MITTRKKRKKQPGSTVLFNVLGYTLISIASIVCLIPFIMLVSGSLTSEKEIIASGYALFPKEISLEAYKLAFKNPEDIIRAYGVSIFVTLCGTLFGLLIVVITAYVLSRPDFKYRNKLSFYFYFTTLFSGGLLSVYIFMIRYLHLKDSILALILPMVMNIFYLLIMKSFIAALPNSICESAKIDGANDFVIVMKIVIPLSKAGLATIGLFYALDYWNDWYHAMLYIGDYQKYPLQYLLYNILSSSDAISRISSLSGVSMVELPSNSMKLAMAVIATGPILLVYPFVQKFFVKGITVGAVKG